MKNILEKKKGLEVSLLNPSEEPKYLYSVAKRQWLKEEEEKEKQWKELERSLLEDSLLTGRTPRFLPPSPKYPEPQALSAPEEEYHGTIPLLDASRDNPNLPYITSGPGTFGIGISAGAAEDERARLARQADEQLRRLRRMPPPEGKSTEPRLYLSPEDQAEDARSLQMARGLWERPPYRLIDERYDQEPPDPQSVLNGRTKEPSPLNKRVYNAALREKNGGLVGPEKTFDSPLGRDLFVTSHFNPKRFHPIRKVIWPHKGIDLRAPMRTEVRAAADGRIVKIEDTGTTGFGKSIRIEHYDGTVMTLYGHLDSFADGWKEGDTDIPIMKGALIGLSGNSGASEGPHLHYEVHVNGVPVNPVGFLGLSPAK